jgi:large subunit ribosomal protein L14e
MLDVGRVCLKTAGREAGRYCVVVKKMDESFVMITGPKELTSVKRRRCNISHLEPIMEAIKIKSDAPDSEVIKAYQSANLTKKLGLEPRAKPSKGARPEKKAEAKKAEPKKDAPKVTKKPKETKKAAPKKAKPAKKPAKKATAKKAAKKQTKKK